MDRTTTYGHSGGSGVRPFEGLADAVRELMSDAAPVDPAGPDPSVDLGTTPPVRFADPFDRRVRVVVERAAAAEDALESMRRDAERAERSIAELRSIAEELRASNARAERSIAELRSVNERLEVSNARALEDSESARRESDRAYRVAFASLLVSLASLLASVFL